MSSMFLVCGFIQQPSSCEVATTVGNADMQRLTAADPKMAGALVMQLVTHGSSAVVRYITTARSACQNWHRGSALRGMPSLC